MNKKLFYLFLLIILLISLSSTFVAAQQCETAVVKSALRRALFSYFGNPGQSPLSVAELRDLLNFYVSIPTNQLQVDCAGSGSEGGIQMETLVNRALAAIVTVPTCSDGTEYGVCSTNLPQYCYNGQLIPRCGKCCPTNTICSTDGQSCIDTAVNVTNSTTTNGTASGNQTNQSVNLCGNGICGVGETCQNCASDCGACSLANVTCQEGYCTYGATDCSDTEGKNFYVAGTITYLNPQTMQMETKSDKCSSSSGLIEYSCPDYSGSWYAENPVACPCSNGVCTNAPSADSCGNNICGLAETCGNCPIDCGRCKFSASCSDPDLLNFNNSGTIVKKENGQVVSSYSDFCFDAGRTVAGEGQFVITEWVCQSNGESSQKTSLCSGGCENGACRTGPSSCVDTDGKNDSISGLTTATVNGETYNYQDYCMPLQPEQGSNHTLSEYYCSNEYTAHTPQKKNTVLFNQRWCGVFLY